MKKTGIFASKKDTKRLFKLSQKSWVPGKNMLTFRVGYGIRQDHATRIAKEVCHKLALQYGLPDIEEFYTLQNDGEFISVEQ